MLRQFYRNENSANVYVTGSKRFDMKPCVCIVIVLFTETFQVESAFAKKQAEIGARVQIEMLEKGFRFFKESCRTFSRSCYSITHGTFFLKESTKMRRKGIKERVKPKKEIKLDECSFVMNVTRSHNLWPF